RRSTKPTSTKWRKRSRALPFGASLRSNSEPHRPDGALTDLSQIHITFPAMDLILWRHAEAEPGEPDLGRRLTAKGHKQAEKVAEWLEPHLPDNCRILVSPAQRAQQTAAVLGRKYKTVPEIGPGASPEEVLA